MKKLSPYPIIVGSYLLIIFLGTILFLLPISYTEGNNLNFVDSFFLSTSATTITGLFPTPDTANILSSFGKVVLAVLIQIGGLSIVTLSIFIMYLIGVRIGIANRILIRESFSQDSLSGMVRLVKRIVIFTLCIELIGFIINFFIFIPQYDLGKTLALSAFHAISSFNNAGVDLFDLTSAYQNNMLFNINTILLVMIGSTGFIVFNDLWEKKSFKRLTIHSKIVIKMNLILWLFGIIVFSLFEFKNGITWYEAVFLSVNARSAGFTTVNIATLSSISLLVLMMLMFIGASPASSGGGIKTTTAFTLFKQVGSFATGKQPVTYERLIDYETRHKATVLFTTSILIVFFGTFLILSIENISLDDALFKVLSTFTNAGITMNVTINLKPFSKVIQCLLMIIGRVGPLTTISLFNKNWYKRGLTHIEYIEEKFMIG